MQLVNIKRRLKRASLARIIFQSTIGRSEVDEQRWLTRISSRRPRKAVNGAGKIGLGQRPHAAHVKCTGIAGFGGDGRVDQPRFLTHIATRTRSHCLAHQIVCGAKPGCHKIGLPQTAVPCKAWS